MRNNIILFHVEIKRFTVKKELLIKKKGRQLARIKEHADKSSVSAELYNKIVLEKAILKKEIDNLAEKSFTSKIRYLFPRKKDRICDYFNTPA